MRRVASRVSRKRAGGLVAPAKHIGVAWNLARSGLVKLVCQMKQ